VNHFFLLGPPHHLTIQRVREITSLDSKLPDQTEVHIRSETLAEISCVFKSHFIRTAAALHAVDVSENGNNHKGRYLFTPMQNNSLVRRIEKYAPLKGEPGNAHLHVIVWSLFLQKLQGGTKISKLVT